MWTTLDPGMQRAANRAIGANTPRGAQGALVAIDRDGAVRAMIGGRDYVNSIYNRATQAERQPGSAWKLFVYLAALESGMKPTDTLVDEPVTINGWTPRNSTRTYAGPVTLREAFARSINTISAKIGDQLGFSTIADMARRFGISGTISTYPSMVLGTSEVRLIDMTRAFAAVSNRGVSTMPYAIRKVVTSDGRLLYQHAQAEERVLVAPYVAAGMTDLLQTAVLSGTGRAAQIGRPVAGKTGTTSSNKDGWFVGFSSGLTTGVWMGRDDARPVAGLQGGTAPARAFSDFMRVAVARRPVENFQLEVPLPDWQLEPDEEVWGNTVAEVPLVDADGNPIDPCGRPGRRIGAPAPQRAPDERARPAMARRSARPRPAARAAPAAAARAGAARRRRRQPRPTRFSRGPSRRNFSALRRRRRRKVGLERVEAGAVVHVDAVRDFMRDDISADLRRGEQQPPIIANRARRRAATPARPGIADADRASAIPLRAARARVSSTSRRRASSRSQRAMRSPKRSAGPPQRSTPSTRRGVRGAAASQRSSDRRRRRTGSSRRDERLGGLDPRKLRLDPVRLAAAQSSAARRLTRRGTVSRSRPRGSSSARRRRRARGMVRSSTGHGRPASANGVRGRGRQGETQARRRRLR